jgi:hypothetical protein
MASVASRKPRRSTAAERRRSQLVGAFGVLLAALLPVYLWHDVVADIASVTAGLDTTTFVVGWAPWVLMVLGLLCTIPIVVEHIRTRDRRFYRPGTGAWVGWGVSLYIMGFALATQVAQIHGLHA